MKTKLDFFRLAFLLGFFILQSNVKAQSTIALQNNEHCAITIDVYVIDIGTSALVNAPGSPFVVSGHSTITIGMPTAPITWTNIFAAIVQIDGVNTSVTYGSQTSGPVTVNCPWSPPSLSPNGCGCSDNLLDWHSSIGGFSFY